MSWLYLPEVVVVNMPPSTSLDGVPSATSKKTRGQSKSSKQESEMASSMMHQSGMTSTLSTADLGADLWISSLRDSRANRIAQSEIEAAHPILRTNGLTQYESLARFDPVSRSWKTSLALLPADTSIEYSPTFTKSGIQLHGILYLQQPLAHLTNVDESGFLPTPTATDGKRTYSSIKTHWSLSDALGGFPHPATHEWMMGWPIGGSDSISLEMDGFRQWLHWLGNIFDSESLYDGDQA